MYSFNRVGYGDFKEGGEVCDSGAAGVSEDGELGQEHVQWAPLGGQCQQLAVIRPGQGAQPWNDRAREGLFKDRYAVTGIQPSTLNIFTWATRGIKIFKVLKTVEVAFI